MYRLLIHIRESHREFRQQFIAGGIVSEKSIYTGQDEQKLKELAATLTENDNNVLFIGKVKK